jgi:phage terminase Nu1 subunit (DNA packaging protein)
MARVYVLLGVLAVIGTMVTSAYIKGRWDGVAAEAARSAKAVQELNDRLRTTEEQARQRELKRLRELAELETTIDQLRRSANADPNASRPAIGLNSVQRLNSIR